MMFARRVAQFTVTHQRQASPFTVQQHVAVVTRSFAHIRQTKQEKHGKNLIRELEKRIENSGPKLPTNDSNYLENMAFEGRIPGPAKSHLSKPFEERVRDGESGDWRRGAEDLSYKGSK